MKLFSITFLFILSAVSEKTPAQQRFIEVGAADTIELKPVQFTYQVSLNTNSNNNYEYSYTAPIQANGDSTVMSLPKPKNNKMSVAQVLSILSTGKYHYTVGEESSYAIYANGTNKDSTILVTVASEAELKKLYHLLKPLTDIAGSISHVDYESAPGYQNAWYSRLYEKAKASATQMAQASGNTLGQLLSVEEDKNVISQAIEEMKNTESEIVRANFYRTDFSRKVYKKMLFKFELK